MFVVKYKVYNFTDENRIFESNGVKFRHLGTIEYDGEQFVIYEANGQRYIEKLVSSKKSDILVTADKLEYIDDDKLWLILFNIAKKEGIL